MNKNSIYGEKWQGMQPFLQQFHQWHQVNLHTVLLLQVAANAGISGRD